MTFIIWNKTDIDTIDVLLLSDMIKVKINDKTIYQKDLKSRDDYKIYEKILDDIREINEAYLLEEIDRFKELSDKFFENLETL